MKYLIEYDKSDPVSIERYAQGLLGKTFRQICEADSRPINSMVSEPVDYRGSVDVKETKRNKGNLGQLIEEHYFHYECNSDSRPDFHEAGVELKVTPYMKKKDGSLSAKERLIISMIDYCQVVKENFETSHLWMKARQILLVYYLYSCEIEKNIDYRIDYAKLFTPPQHDLQIIKHDFEIIVEKVKAGKANELSEADTLYLGAATKSSDSTKRREQPFSDEPAKPRAFAFKQSYMTYVLRNYIVPGSKTCESIESDTETESFEDYVKNKIDAYKGYSIETLAAKYNVDLEKKPKNLEAMLAYRILGIKGNRAEEFEKANIVMKAIRIGSNGKIKESMSFPTFRFKELVNEDWEDSTLGNYLRETRFFFVVYKYDENEILRLRGCQFWSIPYDDLEGDVKKVWNITVDVIKNGLQIKEVDGIRYNNFPKASENAVCHVRPHAKNAKDTYELPDGREYTKQCFWLNNSYILSQINENLR